MSKSHAHGQFAHFSINVDDMERAQTFYSAVFGWDFVPYGPPGFFMVSFAAPAISPVFGSVQGRRDLLSGQRTNGLECTFAVDDIDETIRKIQAFGGKIVLAKSTLPGIGHLIFFQDPEGNAVGAMQYDTLAS